MTKHLILTLHLKIGDDTDGEAISTAVFNWLHKEAPPEIRPFIHDVQRLIEVKGEEIV
jgi:hypothetical protein